MNKFYLLLYLFFVSSLSIHAQSIAPSADKVLQEKEQFRALSLLDAQSVSSPNFDVYFYRCTWDVDPAVRFINGSVSAYFTITAPNASITFDLSQALTVDSVLYHGTKIGFQQTVTDALQIHFPAALAQGQKDSLTIFYKGVPPGGGFGSFVQSTHSGTPILWTLSEPYGAKDWWPCKDVLTDKADSIDIIITYPSGYHFSSNGLLVQQQIIGTTKQDYWKHRYPIASYLVAMAVTDYTIVPDDVQLPSGKMPVVLYTFPESETTMNAATTTAKACLQKFSALIGEYPFSKERYAQTQFGWGGGMEHQTNTFIVAPNASLVAHELAHQWFGDKVTTGSWQDLWLNEGFATYMELVFLQTVQQSDPHDLLQRWQNNITAVPGGSVFITDTANINRLFDGRLTYTKGGYVLHMLRGKLGDSAFFRGLRQYLNDPAVSYKNARTADLQRNLESVSGQELTGFFNDWVYGEGFPSYTAEWGLTRTNAINVKLSQTTSHPSVPFYEMPVPLYFKSATRDTLITVNHTRNGEVFTLKPGFTPDTLIIDPQLWILTKDNHSIKTEPAFQPTEVLIYPNPAINTVTVYLPAGPTQKTSIQVFNALGQQVFLKTVISGGSEEIAIPTYNLASGTYWIEINRATGGRIVKPFLIIRP